MFNRLILGVAIFFCIAFQTVSAYQTSNYHLGKTEIQEAKFSVNKEKLFLEDGKLFFESEYNGVLPLNSINYLNGKCYTNLSFEIVDSYQGYMCNHCQYVKIVERGLPGKCPRCGRYDWTIM